MNYQGNYERTTDGKKTHHRIIQISGGPDTLVKSSNIYTGQHTFPISLLNDDNMLVV